MFRLPRPPSRVRWSVAAAVTTVVVGASLVPRRALPPASAPGGADLLAHAVGYAAVAAAVAYAIDEPDRAPLVTLGSAFVAAVAVGATVELVQPAVGRSRSLADAGANAVGAAIALLVYRVGHRWIRST